MFDVRVIMENSHLNLIWGFYSPTERSVSAVFGGGVEFKNLWLSLRHGRPSEQLMSCYRDARVCET